MSLSADRCVQCGGSWTYIVKTGNKGMEVVVWGTAACKYCDINNTLSCSVLTEYEKHDIYSISVHIRQTSHLLTAWRVWEYQVVRSESWSELGNLFTKRCCGVPRAAHYYLQLVSIPIKQQERTWYLPDGVNTHLLHLFIDCGIVNSTT